MDIAGSVYSQSMICKCFSFFGTRPSVPALCDEPKQRANHAYLFIGCKLQLGCLPSCPRKVRITNLVLNGWMVEKATAVCCRQEPIPHIAGDSKDQP